MKIHIKEKTLISGIKDHQVRINIDGFLVMKSMRLKRYQGGEMPITGTWLIRRGDYVLSGNCVNNVGVKKNDLFILRISTKQGGAFNVEYEFEADVLPKKIFS